jgi:hypothetical protein
LAELNLRLGEIGQGILCLSAENVHEPWLNFEAGALSRSLTESRVRPVLLDLEPAQVVGPLAQFQATDSRKKTDMFKLIRSLNDACASPLDAGRVERAFDQNWDRLSERLNQIRQSANDVGHKVRRSPDEMLAEILDRVRQFQRDAEVSRALNSVELGDGSSPRIGGVVHHAGLGSGFVIDVAPTPTLADPSAAIVRVRFESEIRDVPSAELRITRAPRPSPPSPLQPLGSLRQTAPSGD